MGILACGNGHKKEKTMDKHVEKFEPFFKISLAQWSLHKAVEDNGEDPFDFAKEAKELGIDAVEYVTQLYEKQIDSMGFQAVVDRLKQESEKHGVRNILIMVDDEGDLADPNDSLRNDAVEKHKKWVDAAQILGCHAIRVNTFGTNDPEIWMVTVVDGLKKLSEYAATKDIKVLVENHGWLSSDAHKVMEAIKAVNLPNCGTLPDFGNWCIKRFEGERWGECEEEFPDKYEGVKILMPAAAAVSAKSYDFDEQGNETTLDYMRMIQIVKDADYSGYIGIESEQKTMDEREGIKATYKLLLKAAKAAK
jgi:sugar phosphate isomerase/epimerase